MNDSARQSIPARIYHMLASFGLATILLLILLLETWTATLEMKLNGLFPTVQKYFDIHNWYVFPDAGIFNEKAVGKLLPPLPGGYWVCALLALNLTLGGIIRMRKGWKTAGVLMSHFAIVFMIVAGGVAQLKEERGVMMLSEDDKGLPKTADYASSLTETSIEITEVKDGKAVGPVQFVKDAYYSDLGPEQHRKVMLPKLPFDLEVQGYVQNAKAMSTASMAPERGEPVVDGWFIFSRERNKDTEMDTPGVHARIVPRDGGSGQVMLLVTSDPDSFTPRAPVTVKSGDRTFLVRLDKRVWPVPFKVTLVDARSEYHPNTNRPKLFESDIIRTQDGHETKHFIEMNKPLRQEGLTLYQRTMMNGPGGAATEATISGFEVVRNPSDKWPEWSIYVAGFGLVLHFLLKLGTFLFRGKSTPAPQST
ncbi:cytochrome c biogenesis protein ResB [Luteolibacter soli]|uniref:Cytochrome c biogenesis protein ResB n=1 Tax=Luteolibacter soli TaxID=3135280 RepID=A0ABU9AYQ8_9BACT